jgi:hypothetical protein
MKRCGRHHRVAWAQQTAKGIGQKCEKLRKPGFLSGEYRNRTNNLMIADGLIDGVENERKG